MSKHDDTRLGRARVTDTPELEAYYADLERIDAGALWTVANDIEPWEPTPSSAPVIWRWADMRREVLRAVDLVRPEDAGRRVVYLRNPKRRDVSAACGWLFSGLQVMGAGERAGAHRHAASALRFIMEGSGAFTVVDGHRVTLNARDFVLTPNGTWHEHGVLDEGTECIWQDGLDIPLTNTLEANFYEVHPDQHQASVSVVDGNPATWGHPGLRPETDRWDKSYSPLLKFRWDQTYEALTAYAKVTDGSPFDGVLMRYTNPVTGGDPMQTMGASMQLLRPGERTRAHRHTGNAIYQVARGSGHSIIGGRRFDWTERDIFCVPPWTWHEHANASDGDDAVLFSFDDLPVMRKLGFYAEQALEEGGGHQAVASDPSASASPTKRPETA